MKRLRFSFVALIAVALCLSGASAFAWEFGLEAGFAWNWYSGWQMGDKGFFGPYGVDNSANATNIQNSNFWAGANKWDGVFPHAHVSTNTIYMEFAPEFSINEAVRIRGIYYIGAWDGDNADKAASEHLNSTDSGALVSFSPGYWTQLWATAQTPWGILAAGKRPFAFGIGGIASGEDCTTTESLLMVAPYGPFRLGLAIFPARTPGDASVAQLNAELGGGTAFAGEVGLQDENGGILRNPDVAAFVTYRCGPLDIGIFSEYARWSIGPESLVGSDDGATGRIAARANFMPYDFSLIHYIFYLKYANGRFFFNAEADIQDSMTRRMPPLAGTYGGQEYVDGDAGAGSLWQTGHVFAKRFYAEGGALFGPTKLTGLLAWVDGYDRRHGVLIDKQGTGLWLGHPRVAGSTWGGLVNWFDSGPNGIIFYPYSYLMVFNYGGGNNHFNVQGDGYLVDAVAAAAKVDYAVAANLNIWASFFYADRLSKGYGLGYIGPDGEGNVAYTRQGTFDNPAPAIPDSNLGWEIGFGVDWQLLEGLMFGSRVAYWQPGEWFKYACKSKTETNWDDVDPTAPVNWGVNPNRTIDPVMGLEMTLGFEF